MHLKTTFALLSLVSLTACQSTPVSSPLPNPVAAVNSITAESCKGTLESYFQKLMENPEKYQNITAYPELVTYSETLDKCMKSGHINELEMAKSMERVAAKAEGRAPNEAAVEEGMRLVEKMQGMSENMSEKEVEEMTKEMQKLAEQYAENTEP